jgi:hypothetical protein
MLFRDEAMARRIFQHDLNHRIMEPFEIIGAGDPNSVFDRWVETLKRAGDWVGNIWQRLTVGAAGNASFR